MSEPCAMPSGDAPSRASIAARIGGALAAHRGMIFTVLPTLGARGFVIVCGLASSIITAKVLGPEGRGSYFYIITLAQLATQIGNLGLASSNTFVAAQNRSAAGALAANSFWIALALGGIATVATVAFQMATGRPDRAALAIVLLVLVPCLIYGMLASSILVGTGRAKAYNAFLLVNTGLQLAAIMIVGLAFGTVEAMLWVSAGASLVASAMLMWMIGRQGQMTWRFDWGLLKREIGFSSRVYIATLVQFAVARLNVMLLDHTSGAVAVGQYSIAVQFFDTLLVVPSTTAMLLFPELVRSDAANRLSRTLQVGAAMALLMIIVAIAFIAISPWLIPLMFGQGFAPAVDVVRWMMPGLVAFSLLNIVSQYLAAARFPLSNLLVWIVSLPVLGVLASFLVPAWGASGAAAALSITYVLLAAAIVALAIARHRTSSAVVP